MFSKDSLERVTIHKYKGKWSWDKYRFCAGSGL